MCDANNGMVKKEQGVTGNLRGCPLRVDPRVLLKKRVLGDFKGAYQYYKSRVLFPEIVSEICTGSCFAQSKGARSKLLVSNIERTCAGLELGRKQSNGLVLGKDVKRAAVIGGGLSGMAAAAFLRKHGCEVHVYEKSDRLGGRLQELVSKKSLQRELYEIANLPGIRVLYGRCVEDVDICCEYDAVCNTGQMDWRSLERKNLFHAFGDTPESAIAEAIQTGKRILSLWQV